MEPERAMNDLRYAWRLLRKSPGFTLIAAATLALGIGANTAVFSMVNALLFRPVTFARLDRLTSISGTAPRLGVAEEPVSAPDFLEWKSRSRSFDGLAAQGGWDANLTGGEAPGRVRVSGITPGMLELLSVSPAIGRGFRDDEGTLGHDAVVLLSHALWTERYAARRDVLGRSIRLDGREHLVVGVMAPDFEFPRGVDLWVPLAFSDRQLESRDLRFLSVFGLLKPGVSRDRAQAELATIAADVARRFPATHTHHTARVRMMREAVAGDIAPVFYGLLSLAAALVLLIACANVANLLLARATDRRREIAVRMAMGASRARLLRQLLLESLMLAMLGALGGMLVAVWGVDFMVKSMPLGVTRFIPGWSSFHVDGAVLAFAMAVAVVAGIVFGLAPALETLRVDVNQSLKDGQRGATSGRSGMRARRALVVAQVVLALVLVSGAGLVIQGFQRLLHANPGFDARNVLILRVSLPEAGYEEPARIAEFERAAIERLRAVPGVIAAAAGTRMPWADWGGRGMTYPVETIGHSGARDERVRGGVRIASAGYFETLRIPMLAGRALEESDAAGSEPVIVVSRSFARRLAPSGEVVGRRIRYEHPRFGETERRIAGVCGDVTHTWWEPDAAPLGYVPFAQSPTSAMTIAVRGEGDPLALVPAVRAALATVDRDQPVFGVEALESSMRDLFSPLRLSSSLMMLFGVLALVLAMVGVYGLIAYSVSQRTHEIGVRLALGAPRSSVLGLVLRDGLALAGLGLLIGVPAAWAMGQLAANKMFGVVALDSALLASISAALVAVALLASYLPARHASRVDPMNALRNE
jgi:putative ABC transport system permease protein